MGTSPPNRFVARLGILIYDLISNALINFDGRINFIVDYFYIESRRVQDIYA